MISKIPGSAIVLPPFCTLELPLQIPPRCARPPLAKGGWGDFADKRRYQCANVIHFGLEKLSNTEMDLPRLVAPRRAKRKPEVEAHGTYRGGIAHAKTRRIPEIIER